VPHHGFDQGGRKIRALFEHCRQLAFVFHSQGGCAAKAPVPNMTFLGATAPWQGVHHLSKTAFPFVSEGVWASTELPSPTARSRKSAGLMRGSSSCLPAIFRSGQER
jgi:hypothetical protein